MEWSPGFRGTDDIETYLVANLRPPSEREARESGVENVGLQPARAVLCYSGSGVTHYVVRSGPDNTAPCFLFFIGPVTPDSPVYACGLTITRLLSNVAGQYRRDFLQ